MNLRSSRFPLSRVHALKEDRWYAFPARLLGWAALGLLSLGQAWAQDATAPAEGQPGNRQAVSADPLNKNGKVCKREDVTGSRMPKRVCYTPDQWEARERAAREAVREMDARQAGMDGQGG